jgi:CRP/FNR family transcriptional regulator, dissimilatory nitrate respiration regulator
MGMLICNQGIFSFGDKMTVTLDTLRVLPLFSDLSPEDGALLVRNSRIISRKRGQFLFAHGDKVTHFYVICRGAIQVFRETPGGEEVTSNILIAGDSINAGEVIASRAEHAMNARAVDDCSLLEIPVAWMREHLNDFDPIAKKLLSSLVDKLHEAEVEAEHHTTMSAAQIGACYLQKLCVLYNFDPHGFELPYSKTLIASRLRIKKETFSRTLQTLRNHGITVTGAHVSIKDMRNTGNFVCGECSVAEECATHHVLHERLGKISRRGI